MSRKEPSELSHDALVEIAEFAQVFLFGKAQDDGTVHWTLDKDVSGADFVQEMTSLLAWHRLAPDDGDDAEEAE